MASALAEQGESLILAGRDSEKLARARQLLSQKSASVDTVVLDISKEEEVIQLSQTLGEVDNVIVTAGSQAPGGALASLNLNEARLAFDTKFWGSIHVARHLSKNIKARGTLTLTSGFVSRRTVAGAIVKTTMNAAPESAVKVLAKELSPLRVNAVSPGLTDTEAYAGMDPAARENCLRLPLKICRQKPSGGQRTSQKAICS